tara:strand:- start:938 stop:1492 length:555 start_codon:yes stop_codon:yes gene_type:complete
MNERNVEAWAPNVNTMRSDDDAPFVRCQSIKVIHFTYNETQQLKWAIGATPTLFRNILDKGHYPALQKASEGHCNPNQARQVIGFCRLVEDLFQLRINELRGEEGKDLKHMVNICRQNVDIFSDTREIMMVALSDSGETAEFAIDARTVRALQTAVSHPDAVQEDALREFYAMLDSVSLYETTS